MSGVRFCHIEGLTSPKGKALNGRCGRVQRKTEADRLSVDLDGVADPVSVKQTNLKWLPPSPIHFQNLESDVGRQSIRDERFNAIITDQDERKFYQPYTMLGKYLVS